MSGSRSRPNHGRTPSDIRQERRRRAQPCLDHLVVAPLWITYEANLGTLLRTCDAVGACMAVHRTRVVERSLARGDTLRHRPHMHWVNQPESWLARQRDDGWRIVGVELADGATRLGDLPTARQRTIVVLGHEHDGVPDDAFDLLDEVVEIPMIGVGSSLNVAVAGSLVLYRLAGLS